MKCMIDGCGADHYAKGLCGKHWQRLRTTGTLQEGEKGRGSLITRFLKKFKVGSPSDCWLWTGAKTGKGYGAIQEAGKGSKLLLAHRVSFEHFKRALVDGEYVLHSCDVRNCVNPNHLRAGTQSENIIEAFEKGRKTLPAHSGEANGKSKLTLEQVKFIRAHPEMQHLQLAKLFGLSPNCIRGVRIGRTWKDV